MDISSFLQDNYDNIFGMPIFGMVSLHQSAFLLWMHGIVSWGFETAEMILHQLLLEDYTISSSRI